MSHFFIYALRPAGNISRNARDFAIFRGAGDDEGEEAVRDGMMFLFSRCFAGAAPAAMDMFFIRWAFFR